MDNQLTLISTAITASVLAGQEILKIYNDPAADFSVKPPAESLTNENEKLVITNHSVLETKFVKENVGFIVDIQNRIFEAK